VFEGVRRRGINAAVIIEAPTYWNGRSGLAELSMKHRIAMMVPSSEYVEAGGLMFYGADVDEVHGRAAGIVDRILKGGPARRRSGRAADPFPIDHQPEDREGPRSDNLLLEERRSGR
jgi:hypothetical protein